jgi:HlyD family secretion protein
VSREQIFRKVALERLASPEQLDTLMEVTKPRSWVGLAGLGFLLLVTVVWGVAGSIPTNVDGQGILIRSGGVYDVFATGSGPVAEVLVSEGDLVSQGQVIARIEQSDLQTRIANAKAQLAEMESQHQDLTRFTQRDLSLSQESYLLQESKLQDTISFAEQRLKALQEQIANEETLLERGLITKQAALQTKQSLFSTKDQLEQAKTSLKQLKLNDLSSKNQKDQQVVRSRVGLNDQERSIKLLQEQLKEAAEVTSPYSGRVIEVKVRNGDIVNRGASIVSLQLADQAAGSLEAVIYVEAKDGKYIKPGMDVQLSPLSAPREDYGFLKGKVTYVSEFPSTREGMMKVLANSNLVTALSAGGAPFAVYASLIPKPEAPGGFEWSSPRGEQLIINSGTMCSVKVTVLERRPMDLVIPYLRKKSGI